MLQLTPKQQKIVKSPARVKFIMGGVRSGKTITSLLALLEEMKRTNNPNTKAVIYEITCNFLRQIYRDIKALHESGYIQINEIQHMGCGYYISTPYGTIDIKLYDEDDGEYDISFMDAATRNKYFNDIYYKNILSKLIISGHCPKDTENPFYKMWLDAYKSDIPDIKAFRLGTWDNPAMADKKDDWENRLIAKMGLENYFREYYAIRLDE